MSWLDAPARRYRGRLANGYRGMSGVASDADALAAKIQDYLTKFSVKEELHAYPELADAIGDMHQTALSLREQQDPATVTLLKRMQYLTDQVAAYSYSDMVNGGVVVQELVQWMALAEHIEDPGLLTVTMPMQRVSGVRLNNMAPVTNLRAQPDEDATAPTAAPMMTKSMGIGAAIGAALGGVGLGLATGSAGYGAGGAVVGAVVGAGAAHYYEQGKAKPTP